VEPIDLWPSWCFTRARLTFAATRWLASECFNACPHWPRHGRSGCSAKRSQQCDIARRFLPDPCGNMGGRRASTRKGMGCVCIPCRRSQPRTPFPMRRTSRRCRSGSGMLMFRRRGSTTDARPAGGQPYVSCEVLSVAFQYAER
jgi:hypothetical protein